MDASLEGLERTILPMWQIILVDANGAARNGGYTEYLNDKAAMEEAYYRADRMNEKYGHKIRIVGVVLDKLAD